MKVLLLNGSPHVNGSTHRALVEIEETLHAEGIETELMHVGTDPIRGCMGCGVCRKNKLGRCIFGEDAVNVAIKKMESCDALIVGTPVHYGNASGAITSFLDRMFYSSKGFPNKPAASVAVCRRAGANTTLDQINKYFTLSNMPVISSAYWNMVFGNSPAEVEQDKEGMMVMRTVARNMAWILKCIEAGKAAGVADPYHEKQIRTNFIRKIEPEHKNFSPYFIDNMNQDK